MSGHKLSTLRIQKAASARIARRRMRKAFLQKEVRKRNEELREQHFADMERIFADMERRQARFSDSMHGYQSRTLQRLEQETNTILLQSNQSIYEDMQSMLNHIWLATNETISEELQHNCEIIENQRQDLFDLQTRQSVSQQDQQSLAKQFRENQQQIAATFHEFDKRQSSLAENQHLMFQQVQNFIQQQQELGRFQESKEEIVHKQIADTSIILEFILSNEAHEKFTPGEAHASADRLDNAQVNLSQGFLDAAMIDAQQAYQNLSSQRVILEERKAHWELLHLDVVTRLKELKIYAESLNSIASTDLDGNETDQQIDVDYWSSRRLSRAKTMIQSLIKRVETTSNSLHTDDLLAIQQQDIPELFNELENTCTIAIEEALNSQLRLNIADIVIQSLENQGFVLASSAYNHNDQRKAFSANVTNKAGEEIVIAVEPDQTVTGQNKLHILSSDAPRLTEHELKQRAEEIRQSLGQFALDSAPFQILSKEDQPVRRKPEDFFSLEEQQDQLVY